MAERIRSSNVRVRGSQVNNRRIAVQPVEDYSEEIQNKSNNRNPRNNTRRSETKNNNQQNNNQLGRNTRTTARNTNPRSNQNRNTSKRTTQPQRGVSKSQNVNVRNRGLVENSNVVEDIIDNSKGIINTIIELFKEDGIDFTVNNNDFYAEALIAEGNADMYPLIRNLTTHLAVLKVLEQHINEVLNLTETPVAPARREVRGRNTAGDNRRVRVR